MILVQVYVKRLWGYQESEEITVSWMRGGGGSVLNFGEYRDRAYVGILSGKPNYVSYICAGSNDRFGGQEQFQKQITLTDYGPQ